MQPAGPHTTRAGALGAGGMVLGALLAWNLGNFLFFVIAGRMLGPEDYGLLAALLATTVVAMAVASAFQYAVAREEGARAPTDPGSGAVYRAAFREALVAVPALALVACAAIVLVGRIEPGLPVGEAIATVAVVVPMVAFYLAVGQLQAEHRFGALSAATATLGLPRPVVLVPLAALGLAVYAGLIASAVAVALAAVVAVVATRDRLWHAERPAPERRREYHRSLPPLIAGLAGLALLTNLDVVVAKLALSAQQAGEFGAIAVLGKAVVVVPQAVSTIVLPRVAARRAAGGDTGPLLAAAIGISLATGGLITAAAFLLDDTVMRLTYGEEYVDGAHLLGPMAAAATLLGALIVLLNHHIGRRADAFVWGLLAVAGLEAVLLAFFHDSAGQIIAVDIVACGLGLVAHELIMRGGPDGIVAGLIRLARGRGHRAAG